MKQDESCVAGDGGYPGDCELTQHLLKRAAARKKSDGNSYVRSSCFPKAKPIKLLLLDVDGVLTDGTIMYTHEGTEIKSFHTHDGLGLRLLKEAGVETGLITARSSKALTRRANDLSINHVYQDVSNKVEIYEKLLKELGLTPSEVAYMGDDWLDLRLLARVGFSITVADGADELKQVVHYVTKTAGGRGAVREVCDLIIDAKEMRELLLAGYLETGRK